MDLGRKARRGAFTSVELLIVIGIIALIVVILLHLINNDLMVHPTASIADQVSPVVGRRRRFLNPQHWVC